jgi:hypothetical protein
MPILLLCQRILLALVVSISTAVGIAIAYSSHKHHKKLPPYSPESMWQNMQASLVQKRISLLGVDPKSLGFSEQGNTYLLALPTPAR